MRWLKIFCRKDPAMAFKKKVKGALRRSPDEVELIFAIFAAKKLGINLQGLCRVGSLKKADFIAVIQADGRYVLYPPGTKVGNKGGGLGLKT
jgi:hypothetical protein